MYTETEGIILRQTKTLNGRRMITLFSKRYGKISAGTSLSERGKNKSSLAIRPFCRGNYELFKNRDSFSINGAEVIESYYSIGEDIDKFMAASAVLELTDAMLGEDQPQPAVYELLCSYLSMMSERKAGFGTLGVGYRLKALQLMGSGVNVKRCMRCGKEKSETGNVLSVADGGLVCASCAKPSDALDPLIFPAGDDIINVVSFINDHPLKSLEKLAIRAEIGSRLDSFLSAYISYHLGIDRLKSDGLLQ
jgi:DNA repair protein RecO (recombination protein O)